MKPAEAPDLEGKVSPTAAPHHPQHRASPDSLCKNSQLLLESNRKKIHHSKKKNHEKFPEGAEMKSGREKILADLIGVF